jgi:hypothetical protein
VREDGDEAVIIRRLPSKVVTFLLAGKEDRLRGQRATIRLNACDATGQF